MLNLHLHDQNPSKTEEEKNKKTQASMANTSTKRKKKFDPAKYIEEELDEKIYKKLKYFPDQWYEDHSIEFVFTDEAFRIINKQFYPYIKFADGTKMEFDALLIATGLFQKLPSI